MFKGLLGVLVVMLVMVAAVHARNFNAGNIPTPIFCSVGQQNVITGPATSTSVSTACITNEARLAGYVLNISTAYLKCRLTTANDTKYFYLYAADDTYGRDRFNFNIGNNVYQGALYFSAVDTDMSTVNLTSEVSVMEWK